MVSPFYKALPYEEYLRGVIIRDTFISYNRHLRQREKTLMRREMEDEFGSIMSRIKPWTTCCERAIQK